MSTVSVLILTLNEETNLADCIDSCAWSDDIVVFDSMSADRTQEIARAKGARVVERAFDNYAAQRNAALTTVPFKHPWVLMVDADERIPASLKAEILAFVANPPLDVTLCFMRRRDHLYGRWIRRSSGYPTWFGRFVKVGHAWVERPVNEEYHTRGKIAHLRGHLDHYPFNKGFAEWIAKHNRYSSSEAALKFSGAGDRPHWSQVFSRNSLQRRKALKSLLYTLPARPLLMFIALYIVKGGFLEGRAGLTFSLLRAWYEFMIECKVRELQRRERGLPV
jgi:glycosyltransferase involved in cell wall biosynthesis